MSQRFPRGGSLPSGPARSGLPRPGSARPVQERVVQGRAASPLGRGCNFWSCPLTVQGNRRFCHDHEMGRRRGVVDDCPDCGRGKDSRYPCCLECRRDRDAVDVGVTPSSPFPQAPAGGASRRPAVDVSRRPAPPLEHSARWDRGDASASCFYAYLLRLSDGSFYAGQTREIRERLMEHRDGAARSTSGRNPKLVWFMRFPSREDAAAHESRLKALCRDNPRQVRRMIRAFQDIVGELDFS